ncbi:hypothetical protein [Microbacterium sp. B24]|uniref:hypothetical protein n=1 Tax=Microbacterium sp. B24 TaxID=95616 RepID=UPI00040DEC95|nr:hypothetical protein [Microbacterium sp. B24]
MPMLTCPSTCRLCYPPRPGSVGDLLDGSTRPRPVIYFPASAQPGARVKLTSRGSLAGPKTTVEFTVEAATEQRGRIVTLRAFGRDYRAVDYTFELVKAAPPKPEPLPTVSGLYARKADLDKNPANLKDVRLFALYGGKWSSWLPGSPSVMKHYDLDSFKARSVGDQVLVPVTAPAPEPPKVAPRFERRQARFGTSTVYGIHDSALGKFAPFGYAAEASGDLSRIADEFNMDPSRATRYIWDTLRTGYSLI